MYFCFQIEPMVQSTFDKWLSKNKVKKSSKILLACSGGMDSMALAQLLLNAGLEPSFAHINYHLRGQDAIADQEFVEQFAQQHQLNCYVKEVESFKKASTPISNLQEKARNIRYDFFRDLVKTHAFEFVLTAHHLNDQLETLLFQLGRKTYLQALSGIPKKINNIHRPLLNCSRDEIEQFVTEHGLKFREDSSNQSNKYTRNTFRNEVIKPLENAFPKFLDQFKVSKKNIDDGIELYTHFIEAFYKNNRTIQEEKTTFSLSQINQFPNPEFLLYKVLYPFGVNRDQNNQLFNAINKGSIGAEFLTESHTIILRKDSLDIIEGKNKSLDQTKAWSINQKECSFAGKSYTQQACPTEQINIKSLKKQSAAFDAKQLKFPLTWRYYQVGDQIQAFGMKGKKKLVKKVLSEAGLNRIEKNQVAILMDQNGQIIWIPNYAHSNLYAVSENTQSIMYITTKGS